MVKRLRPAVPSGWASEKRERSFTECFCVYTRVTKVGVTKVGVSDEDRNCLGGV